MPNLGSRQIADMIAETIKECQSGYPDAALVMEGFAYEYAARMKIINPKFQQRPFMNRAMPKRDE